MKVFHYCAEVLKEQPLFESCRDEDILKKNDDEGAVYNDFENSGCLLEESDFTTSDSENEVNIDKVKIKRTDIDLAFLQADDEDPDRWHFKSNLFEANLPPSSFSYQKKVKDLLEGDWDMLDLDDSDIER